MLFIRWSYIRIVIKKPPRIYFSALRCSLKESLVGVWGRHARNPWLLQGLGYCQADTATLMTGKYNLRNSVNYRAQVILGLPQSLIKQKKKVRCVCGKFWGGFGEVRFLPTSVNTEKPKISSYILANTIEELVVWEVVVWRVKSRKGWEMCRTTRVERKLPNEDERIPFSLNVEWYLNRSILSMKSRPQPPPTPSTPKDYTLK